MAFDDEKWNRGANQGDVGGAYLSLAITITPIIEALTKIEEKTGADLSAEKKRLQELNADTFKRFKEFTGWADDK